MKRSKKILILANKYPNKLEPTTNMFIQQLSWEFADMGYECEVVCPLPINFNLKYLSISSERFETTENGNKVRIYNPKYVSLGQRGNFLRKFRVLFTTKMYEIAVNNILKRMKNKPDFLYAYFLCPTSVVASRLGLKYKIPAFMEHGEAIYNADKKYGNKRLAKELRGLNGVIAVSNQNKGYVVNSGIVKEEITVVYPNCFREERFFPIDKTEARKHFGWNEKDFIVGYAGSLDERKGVSRLEKAVDELNDVFFACAGSGKIIPTSDKCLLAKPVLHNELLYFYNALDAFVLPTLAEGSCTATAEAIGCGCPIISSDRSFNENLCDKDNSILIDPESIVSIKNAIQKIYDDRDLLKKMSLASIKKSKNLRQKNRMKNVAKFMEQQAKKFYGDAK